MGTNSNSLIAFGEGKKEAEKRGMEVPLYREHPRLQPFLKTGRQTLQMLGVQLPG